MGEVQEYYELNCVLQISYFGGVTPKATLLRQGLCGGN